MSKTPDIINYITDLQTLNGVIFTGYFIKPGNNIWFIGRVKLVDLRKIKNQSEDTISLYGNVNNVPVCIDKADITSTSTTGIEPEYATVHVLPYELILGIPQQDIPIRTSRIEFEMPELNLFFDKPVVSFECNFDSDSFPAKYNQFERHFSCSDANISIYRMFSCKYSQNKHRSLTFKSINRFVINFDKPVLISEALAEPSKLRLLFCFLADDNIKLPKVIDFADSSCISETEESSRISDKHLWLNDCHYYDMDKKSYPFRIQYHLINDDFESILNMWMDFFSNPLNLPIIELFSNIITSKSVGINRFLNLCQALEVYSTQFRNSEADIVRIADIQKNTINNDSFPKMPTLFHRLIDLFTFHKDIFPNNDEEIELICRDITDIRNYYTHFNPDKQRRLEKKYDDIHSVHTKYEGILHYMLLSTVYKSIGISACIIKPTMNNPDTRFGVFTEELFEGPNMTKMCD
jgi:hypothetical protein